MNSIIIRKKTLFCKLPDEIIEFIWSFNYLWAIKIIKKNYSKYIKYKIYEFQKIINSARFHSKLIEGSYNIFYANKILNNDDIIKILNLCKCCERHRNKKPKKFEKYKETEFSNANILQINSRCSCNCRHLCRFICRYKPPWEI